MRALALALFTAVGAAQVPTRVPDVVFIATEDPVITAMLRIAKVTRDDVVYDLGCGDGRIVIEAARRFGARGVGIDIDPERITEANARARAAGMSSKVRFEVGDIFADETRIADATVVMLYLTPALNEKLKPKLWRELKPGTRVVSNSFDMGLDWPAEKTEQVGSFIVYFWRVPARKAP